jgi:hypothetical protein
MMNLLVDVCGSIHGLYGEAIDLNALGDLTIYRASEVEPDHTGHWWADLALMGGPRLGPYTRRSDALGAEIAWIEQRLFGVKDRPDGT